MTRPSVSVVIPAWREVERVAPAVTSARGADVEVIVAAAWEDAADVERVAPSLRGVRWRLARRGRATQMNAGASAAAGHWLLFLHADSRLPPDWAGDLGAAERAGCAAGCFRLAIDAQGWRPRLLERLVALRVALLSRPYGDQGIFVRRDVFERIGGFRDVPLMEDVDLVRRLHRVTRLWRSRRAVLTSARRWEKDGWFRRSASNLILIGRYATGADVRQLARSYTGRPDTVVAVFGRAPSAPGKSRLGSTSEALRQALLLDTWDACAGHEWDRAFVFAPNGAAAECAALLGPGAALLMPQQGDDLGERMDRAFGDLFLAGYAFVVLVGSDLPTLPGQRLREARHALGAGADVVLGPAADGGYYLVGLSRRRSDLFRAIPWSAPGVLAETLRKAAAAGDVVHMLHPWYDVDDDADLRRVVGEPGAGGTRTRALARQAMAPPQLDPAPAVQPKQ